MFTWQQNTWSFVKFMIGNSAKWLSIHKYNCFLVLHCIMCRQCSPILKSTQVLLLCIQGRIRRAVVNDVLNILVTPADHMKTSKSTASHVRIQFHVSITRICSGICCLANKVCIWKHWVPIGKFVHAIFSCVVGDESSSINNKAAIIVPIVLLCLLAVIIIIVLLRILKWYDTQLKFKTNFDIRIEKSE